MRLLLDEREHATVLAALRYWQREGFMAAEKLGDTPGSLEHLQEGDIASMGGERTPLGLTEIDTLCERINTQEKATELEIETARGQHGSDEIEIDDDAMSSRAKDGTGTWISAWVWLASDDELTTDEEED